MGKQGKKQRHHNQHKTSRRGGGAFFNSEEDNNDQYPPSSSTSKLTISDEEKQSEEEEEEAEGPSEDQNDQNPSTGDNVPSKFSLYQQSVQSPKGDISYLQKFFLMYVGGRLPLHLQEDFCGTALLSTEWLHTDSRRTAVGIDLDREALNWCMENNLNKTGADGYSRIYLFHGNVLNPLEARLVKFENQYLLEKVTLSDVVDDGSETILDSAAQENPGGFTDGRLMKDFPLPARDIICAFNYSCCCLHSRVELVSYFNHSHNALSRKGGIFVMDLYGGTSSECELRLQRKFPNFTYVWEQAGFDIVQRKTRISLHFHLQKQQKKLRHAFSYSWRLWSLPEIKDCLEEAGFRSVHFWIRQMPDAGDIRSIKGFGSGRDVKYEEVSSFEQQDSWNAYVVGVA